MPDLPTISERVYHAASRAANAEGWVLADSRVQLAAIRETHTIEPKPTTGPLGGAR